MPLALPAPQPALPGPDAGDANAKEGETHAAD